MNLGERKIVLLFIVTGFLVISTVSLHHNELMPCILDSEKDTFILRLEKTTKENLEEAKKTLTKIEGVKDVTIEKDTYLKVESEKGKVECLKLKESLNKKELKSQIINPVHIVLEVKGCSCCCKGAAPKKEHVKKIKDALSKIKGILDVTLEAGNTEATLHISRDNLDIKSVKNPIEKVKCCCCTFEAEVTSHEEITVDIEKEDSISKKEVEDLFGIASVTIEKDEVKAIVEKGAFDEESLKEAINKIGADNGKGKCPQKGNCKDCHRDQ